MGRRPLGAARIARVVGVAEAPTVAVLARAPVVGRQAPALRRAGRARRSGPAACAAARHARRRAGHRVPRASWASSLSSAADEVRALVPPPRGGGAAGRRATWGTGCPRLMGIALARGATPSCWWVRTCRTCHRSPCVRPHVSSATNHTPWCSVPPTTAATTWWARRACPTSSRASTGALRTCSSKPRRPWPERASWADRVATQRDVDLPTDLGLVRAARTRAWVEQSRASGVRI